MYVGGVPFLYNGRREGSRSYAAAYLDALFVYFPVCRKVFPECRIAFRFGWFRALVHAVYGRVREKATGIRIQSVIVHRRFTHIPVLRRVREYKKLPGGPAVHRGAVFEFENNEARMQGRKERT